MKQYPSILNSVKLFEGIGETDLAFLLNCIGDGTKSVKKGEIILLAGNTPNFVGIVLTGRLHIIREDFDGNRSLMAAAVPGEIFAEALCCAGVRESPVTVVASADSTVMLLSFSRILHTCPNACSFHTRLIGNMLGLIATRNISLQDQMKIVRMKSVRAKVLRYLEALASKQGRRITIPFNREELADFLCVERSALSHELSKMKGDGLIDYRKNLFQLK